MLLLSIYVIEGEMGIYKTKYYASVGEYVAHLCPKRFFYYSYQQVGRFSDSNSKHLQQQNQICLTDFRTLGNMLLLSIYVIEGEMGHH
jgi:hypothetical protein